MPAVSPGARSAGGESHRPRAYRGHGTAHPLDLTSNALELIDAALATLAAAHASALRADRVGLAGDLLVLGDALDREAEALYTAWEPRSFPILRRHDLQAYNPTPSF